MKKRHSIPLVFGIISLISQPCYAADASLADKSITCNYNQREFNTSGAAELHFKNNKVHRVYFKSYFPGGPGKLSFICDIDLKRNDQAYLWQEDKTGVLITTKETGDTIQLLPNKKKKGYSLNFANLNKLSKYCGDGADVPDDVFIPLAGKACTVTMPH